MKQLTIKQAIAAGYQTATLDPENSGIVLGLANIKNGDIGLTPWVVNEVETLKYTVSELDVEDFRTEMIERENEFDQDALFKEALKIDRKAIADIINKAFEDRVFYQPTNVQLCEEPQT